MKNVLFNEIFLENIYPLIMLDIESNEFNINNEFINLLEYTREDFRQSDIESIYKKLSNCNNTEHSIKTKSGKEVFVKCRYKNIKIDSRNYILVSIEDITYTKKQQLKLEKEKEFLKVLIDNIPDLIFYKDTKGVYLGCNKICAEIMIGKSSEEVIGKTDFELLEDKVIAQKFSESDERVMKNRDIEIYETKVKSASTGEIKEMESKKVPLINKNNEVEGVIGIVRDITNRKYVEEQLKVLSYTDKLTGLYNRTYFEKITSKLKEESIPISLIMGDLNGFKLVNDTFGHLEGDKYIVKIANVIKETCRKKDYIFRWGGDEIIILLPNTSEKEARKVIDKINRKCKEYNYKPIDLSISMGVSTVENIKEYNISKLISKAESELYKIKRENKHIINANIIDSFK